MLSKWERVQIVRPLSYARMTFRLVYIIKKNYVLTKLS